jgi:hypothetical protein
MQLPNARREGLIVEELAGETLVYDLGAHKAHSLNPTAALVWRCCDGVKTVEDAAEALHEELQAPRSEDLVILALDRLRGAKLLADDAPAPSTEISRRSVMKKLALAGGLVVILPVIHSIVAPTPAQAQTCVNPGGFPPGTPCSNNLQCCSNICDQFTLSCL